MRRQILIAATVMAGLAACETSTDVDATVSFAASLNAANEVSTTPIQSSGTGTWSGTLDANNVLTYTLSFTGMTSNVLAAHIHGPASTTQNADILVDFSTGGRTLTTGATVGTGSGAIDLKLAATSTVSGDSLRRLLDAGQTYVNVHTATNPGGEIRGQIIRQ